MKAYWFVAEGDFLAKKAKSMFIKNLILFFAIIFLALFQVTFANYFTFFGVKPDFLIIIVILSGVFLNWRWAIFFSVLAGMLKDVFGVETFGIHIALFACWSYLVFRLSRKVTIDDSASLMVIVFVVAVLNGLVMRFINISLGKPIPLVISLRIICVESFYTVLVYPLIAMIFLKLRVLELIKRKQI